MDKAPEGSGVAADGEAQPVRVSPAPSGLLEPLGWLDGRWLYARHFGRNELACPCGCKTLWVDLRLLALIEAIRDAYGDAVRVDSACRCPSHNAAVGGALSSYHLTIPGERAGRAADLSVLSGLSGAYARLVQAAEQAAPPGMKVYADRHFIHVDVRDGRWRG